MFAACSSPGRTQKERTLKILEMKSGPCITMVFIYFWPLNPIVYWTKKDFLREKFLGHLVTVVIITVIIFISDNPCSTIASLTFFPSFPISLPAYLPTEVPILISPFLLSI